MKDYYDIIIIGAGPAGLACAIELQKSHYSVLVVEKNDKIGPKDCAGGITSKIEEIKSLGLTLSIADLQFSSVKINYKNKSTTISQNKPFVATITREKLGQIMLKKINSDNIEIITNSCVSKIADDYIEVNNQKVQYKYLVGADGSNSQVRRFLGLKNNKLIVTLHCKIPHSRRHSGMSPSVEMEINFDDQLLAPGYAWIFPHTNFTSIGHGQGLKFMRNPGFKNSFLTWLKQRNVNIKQSELRGNIINVDYQGFEFGNKFLIGDAGGFTSPVTGEGIYFAIVSGQEVARKIMDPKYSCPNINQILKIRRAHLRVLNLKILMMKLGLLGACYRLLLMCFRSKWFTKRMVEKFS